MQFSTIFTIFASVAIAATLPAAQLGNSAQTAQCGSGNSISCCNSNSESSFLDLVLGGSCSIQVPVIAGTLGNSCNAGNSFCCPTTEDGEINASLPCVPVNAL